MNQESEFLKLVRRFWVNLRSETADFEMLAGGPLLVLHVRTAKLVQAAKAAGFDGGTPHYGQGYYWRPV